MSLPREVNLGSETGNLRIFTADAMHVKGLDPNFQDFAFVRKEVAKDPVL